MHEALHRVARPCLEAYSNRAACHTALGAFAAAMEDAERCIALEPAWGKGYSRKGHVELLTKEYGAVRPGIKWGSVFASLVTWPY